MIFGCFGFGGGMPDREAAGRVRDYIQSEGLIFHRVHTENFEGGFFLHERNPRTEADFYYSDKKTGISVLMWGTIYNIKELSQKYFGGKPVSSPELAARLYGIKGSRLAAEMNGDFTIFINDNDTRAFLTRDHPGISPAAYIAEGRSVCFSTDIMALCNASEGETDREYLMSYLRFTDRRKCLNKRVKKLLPSKVLEIAPQGIGERWYPSGRVEPLKGLTPKQVVSDLRRLTEDAVRIRCDNRFIAGAHVSGGIDSGIVAAIARKEYASQQPFRGFSWSPESYTAAGAQYDERELARLTCTHCGMAPVFSDIDSKSLATATEAYSDNQGFFSESRSVEQAAERGVNLVFSGWGGDEFISTGRRGIELDLLRELKFGAYLAFNRGGGLRGLVSNKINFVVKPLFGFTGRDERRSRLSDAYYLRSRYRMTPRRHLRDFYFHTSRRQMHMRLLRFYHLQERCEAWAAMAWRRGIEYRYPLLDSRIVRYVMGIPSETLAAMGGYRPLVRGVAEGLLPEVVINEWRKNDPVYWEWMTEMQKEAATGFFGEVAGWREIPDMDFLDFDRLEGDIARLASGQLVDDERALYRTVLYMKGVAGGRQKVKGKR